MSEKLEIELDLPVQPVVGGFISSRCRYIDNCDTNRHVFVDGVAAYVYRITDRVQHRNVIVALLRANLATEQELSDAFGISLRSVSRWNGKYNTEGLEGLIDKTRSGAPEKITAKLRKQIIELRSQRVKVHEIARLLNVGSGSVCRVLYEPREGESKQETFFDALDANPDSEIEDVAVALSEAKSVSGERPLSVNGDCSSITALDRIVDRTMARLGKLEDASPIFFQGHRIDCVGTLLSFATQNMSWYLAVVQKVYRSFGASFYGIRGIFLTFMLMLLLRIKNCEQIREYNPATLGMLLGLDRAPEVKTLRRKLRLLYARERAMECMEQIRALHISAETHQPLATLYLDGHVKAYYGKHNLGRTYSGRLHTVVRGSTEYWVNTAGGKPHCVINTDFNDAMTGVIVEIITSCKEEYQRRGVTGEKLTVAFDRGGYSGKVFEQLMNMNVDFITYNRAPLDAVDKTAFTPTETRINERRYPASPIERETQIDVYEKDDDSDSSTLKTAAAKKTGRVVKLREILILRYDQGITSILTSIPATQRCATEVAAELFNRWPQENYFRYMMEEFALDHLHTYQVEKLESGVEQPNPEYKKIKAELSSLTSLVRQTVGRETLKKLDTSPNAFVRLQKKLSNIVIKGFRSCTECLEKIAALKSLLSTIKPRILVTDYKRLAAESRTFHHFLKMSAYQIETELVELLRRHYPDHNGDARTIVSAMLKSSGTLTVEDGKLIVTIENQSSPLRTRLLNQLCDELNKRAVTYPGSDLTLVFRSNHVDT